MSEEVSKENLTDLISEISALREELASQQTEIKGLRAKVRLLEAEPLHSGQSQTLGSQLATATTSRRNLLKLSGAAAGLAVLSGLSMAANQPHVILAGDDDKPPAPPVPPPNKGPKPPQTSATGDALRLGIGSQAASDQDQTRMYNSSGTILSPILFRADNYTNALLSLPTGTRIGIAGTASGSDTVSSTRIGVYGAADTNGYGIWGNHSGSGYGVYATAGNNGTACVANATGTAEAFYGTSVDDNAIEVYSTNEYGVYAYGGRAAVYLSSSGGDPRSSSTAHGVGELYKDNSGNLWYCTVSGTPGTWRKLGGSSTSGSFHLLPASDRFADTRPATHIGPRITPIVAGPGVGVNFQITGFAGRDGNIVPNGATAVLGNVTLIPVSAGSTPVKLVPSSVTDFNKGTATLIYSGALISNSFSAALGPTGALKVIALGTGSFDLTIEIVGYFM